jgi:hypothetical protein
LTNPHPHLDDARDVDTQPSEDVAQVVKAASYAFHMPRFEVEISDPPPVIDARVSPGGLSSVVRDVYWAGVAADDSAAREAAWYAWDEKYGPGKQPVSAIVRVTTLDE